MTLASGTKLGPYEIQSPLGAHVGQPEEWRHRTREHSRHILGPRGHVVYRDRGEKDPDK